MTRQLILPPPPFTEFNTGDSLERGDSPKAIADKLNAMMGELYGNVYLTPAQLSMRAKVNKLLSGAATRNFRHVVVGSSVDRGVDETASPYAYQYSHSVSQWIAYLLQLKGIPAGANNLFGVGGPSPLDLKNRDSRFTYGGTAPGTGTMSVPGGLTMTFAAGVALAYTFLDQVNQYDVYAMDYHTAGINYDVNIDGGANTNIATTGVDQYRNVVSITAGAVGAHTLNATFGASNGGGWIAGVDAYNNTRKEFSIWNHACAGFTSANLVNQNGAPAGGRLNFYNKFPVDVLGGTFGLTNDWRFNLGPDATYANMMTMANTILAGGGIVYFVTPPFDGGTVGDYINQDKYVAKMIVAQQQLNAPLIDWRNTTGSYAQAFAAGLLGDATHLTANNGALDMAIAIVKALYP